MMWGRIGILWRLWQAARLVWPLLKDPRVPLVTKMVPPSALLYTIFPMDLLPDFLPALGQLDDLALLSLSLLLFIRLCPKEVVREHMEGSAGRRPPGAGGAGEGRVIDGDYEILE
ncbi:MAG: YkvA family protein [Chloroflexota bacterium]